MATDTQMTAQRYIEGENNRLKNMVEKITTEAELSGREYSAEEKAEIERVFTQIKANNDRLDDMRLKEEIRQKISEVDLSPGKSGDAPREARTWGEAFVKSEVWQAMKERGLTGSWNTGGIEMKGFDSRGRKTQLDDDGNTIELVSAAAGATLPLQPQVLPTLTPQGEQKLRISDLFAQGQATQNTLVYLEETTTTPGVMTAGPYTSDHVPATAVTTSEGDEKPAAFIDFTKRSVTLHKLAAFLPVADEMLDDEPQLSSYINGRLSLFVRQAEEAYLSTTLLATSGIGTATAGAVSGSNAFDAIAGGIQVIQIGSGMTPDSVVINPADFWVMAASKASGTGNYFSGGPYAGSSQNLWGLNTVVTNAVAKGHAIVGAFQEAAQVWRKGGLMVAASNSHADYFIRNVTALRAEERIALAVYRPRGFAYVTLP